VLGPAGDRHRSAHQHHVGGADAAHPVGGMGRHLAEQAGGRRGWGGEHHCVDLFAVDHPPVGTLFDALHPVTGPHLASGRHHRTGDRGDEVAQAASWREEHRPSRWRRTRAGRQQHAAVRRREVGDLGNGAQAETIGVGGVDAAHQRIDQPLVHLVAEAAAHVGAE
jgi:hypothetical protein